MKKIHPQLYQLGPAYQQKDPEETLEPEDPRNIKPIKPLHESTELRDPKQKTSHELTKLLNLQRK